MRFGSCVLLVMLAAGCGRDSTKKAPVDLNACNQPPSPVRPDGKGLPEGIEEVFAVGDSPYATFTQLTGHSPGHCSFEEGPNLKKQADGSLVVTGEGIIKGKCGDAAREFLGRKIVKVLPSTGSSIGGLGLINGPVSIKVGEKKNVYAVRLDACDRELRHVAGVSTTRWKIGSCDKLLAPEVFAAPAESIELTGVAAGSCELQIESGGVSQAVKVDVAS